MLIYPGPTSNIERQRQFRERNPGYYGRLHRKRKAEAEALTLAMQSAVAHPVQLALPAPVETLDIPGITTLPLFSNRTEEVLVERRDQ